MRPVLANLEIRERVEQPAWAGLAVAAEMSGIDYRHPELADQSTEQYKRLWDELGTLVELADAFIVSDAAIFREFSEQLNKRIASGARLLVLADVNAVVEMNDFLNRFGLGVTPYRIVPDGSESRMVTIPREPDCFVDSVLLDDVDAVLFNSVFAVRLEREAIPVLLAPEFTWLLDVTSDEINLHTPTSCCIGRWEDPSGGAVVLLGGNIFWDMSRKWTDLSPIPGVQHNLKLATNLLRYAAKLVTPEMSATQYCERAENNLATFVITVLQLRYAEDWWAEAVPETIRKACAMRQEEEARRKFPKEAYLVILDLKAIMQKNWTEFQTYFKSLGETQGKDKALAWLDKFNELRRLVAHPLKMHVAGYKMTPSELELLREMDRRALVLTKSLPQQS